MKKKYLLLLLPLATLLLVALSSCNKIDKDDDLSSDDPPIVNPTGDPYMEVCKTVVKVAHSIDEYYNKCKSMDDLEKYLSDIKKIDNVEDVYTTNTTMYVRIKDYGRISYSFFPKPESESAEKIYQTTMNQMKSRRASNSLELLPYMENKKIAFISQTQNDEGFQRKNNAMEEARKLFEDYGYDVPSNVIAPKVDFFKEGIFDYDIVFLNTHGGYDPKLNVHEFLTSEMPNGTNHDLTAETVYKYKDISTDLVHFGYHNETRRGQDLRLCYAIVSEKWIDKSIRSFRNDKKAIVLNTACHSMQGPKPETLDSISYNVARIFTDKGAGAYFGYDEANIAGVYSEIILLRKLLSGVSLDNAYHSLPFDSRHEYCSVAPIYWADMIAYYNPSNMAIKQTRLHNPFNHIAAEDNSTDYELKVLLSQTAAFFYDECYVLRNESRTSGGVMYLPNESLPQGNPYRYGFFLSKTDDFKDASLLDEEAIGTDHCYATNKNKAYFECTLTSNPPKGVTPLLPETTYYYWPYFYDGIGYYIGDRDSFTTKKLKERSGNTGDFPSVPGTDL